MKVPRCAGGLKKNAQRLFVTCALVNLFVSRKKLLAGA